LLNAVLTAIALVQYAVIVRLGDTHNPIRWNLQPRVLHKIVNFVIGD
jgi:hypothetical protein